ncbi:probable 2-oxoglutarate-dependent dioxygenase SLC1 [Humulus lupulus]|uniref:probable 2-oxoglutarate-dependent dioxygenase SLC1 n=1 Tax=Humulus lupulus TaxID=3486 RepID=UPI002B4138B0|nr:probable 2-oxoglutarate-dependent dioxygenase SLC1 [Humulus lupulus]
MSPAIAMSKSADPHDEVGENESQQSQQLLKYYQKGVKHLYESGITKVPDKYILPLEERPNIITHKNHNQPTPTTTTTTTSPKDSNNLIKLPVIDFSDLMESSKRPQVLKSIENSCQQYGFFQVVNHGIPKEVIRDMMEVSTKFFELPHEERAKYMSSDMKAPVRYGTSFNQTKDKVFCWRDFLKLVCHPISDVLPQWPSSPVDFRNLAATYAKETKSLFLILMEAIVESLGIVGTTTNTTTKDEEKDKDNNIMEKFEDGSQLMVVNCYPPCPQPDLTLGMPPHSDYGFLTLLLQDEVEGLQIQFQDQWLTVDPIPGSFVVNVGDHLEIFSNGKYKSVLHRVLVNSMRARISVASLHSLPFMHMVSPSPKLTNEANPKRYKDTDFSSFLEYISSREPKRKNFLESRKIGLNFGRQNDDQSR